MKAHLITISAVTLAFAAASPAESHHPSGTGTSSPGGLIVTIPGTTLQKGASALYVVFEHFSYDELSDSVLEATEHAHSLATLKSPMLGYSYGPTNRLMVSALLPYVVRTGIREASHHLVLHRFPPLQDPASYNLSQVLEQVKKLGTKNPSQ